MWGNVQSSVQRPKQKGELNKTRLKLTRSEKIHNGDATAWEAGNGLFLSLISIQIVNPLVQDLFLALKGFLLLGEKLDFLAARLGLELFICHMYIYFFS